MGEGRRRAPVIVALPARSVSAVALVLAAGCGYGFGKYMPPTGSTGAGGMGSTTATTTTSTTATTTTSTGTTTTGTAHYCASHQGVTFCEDFDEVTNLAALLTAWDGGTEVAGTGTTLAAGAIPGAPSPPNAFSATADSGGYAYVMYTPIPVNGTLSKVVLSYDIRIDQGNPGIIQAAALTGIVMGTSLATDPGVAFVLGTGSVHGALYLGWSSLNDGGAKFDISSEISTLPPQGQWSGHWTLTIDMSTGLMSVDNGPVFVSGLGPLPAAFLSPTQITILAGLPYNTDSSGPAGVTIDNLMLDLQK